MLFKNNLNNLFQSNLCSIFAHIKFLKELGMRLSELKTGEKGVIIKVLGHGGFRKRIIEMGFIKGKTVEVMLNAPLKDPINIKCWATKFLCAGKKPRWLRYSQRKKHAACGLNAGTDEEECIV